MPSSYNSYVKKVEKELEDEQKKAIEASNQVYDAQESQVRDTFEHQMGESERSYDSLYRENAVQKLINEREIAENMANLGLSDSGLNRTQQTATQLSYANNKKNIDLEKQSALDSLALQMADAISTISQNRIAAESQIKQNFAQTAAQEATKLYEADVNSTPENNASSDVTLNKKEATFEEKQAALDAYNQGGTAALMQYLEGLGESYDIQSIANYAIKYGYSWMEEYEDFMNNWKLTNDTENGREGLGGWFLSGLLGGRGDDHDDVYTKETVEGGVIKKEKLTYDQLKEKITSSDIPEEYRKKIYSQLQKQSKK